jgi:hypothetical protein
MSELVFASASPTPLGPLAIARFQGKVDESEKLKKEFDPGTGTRIPRKSRHSTQRWACDRADRSCGSPRDVLDMAGAKLGCRTA